MSELTFTMIKPNAMKKNVIGAIIKHFEKNHLHLVAAKLTLLTQEQCREFYAEHKDRPFFEELVTFISSGPVLLMVLSGENAVLKAREIMGATDPKEAEANTLRKLYGDSLGENAIHGSDSKESAAREVAFFFDRSEICDTNPLNKGS